jgi:hypothetical protein
MFIKPEMLYFSMLLCMCEIPLFYFATAIGSMDTPYVHCVLHHISAHFFGVRPGLECEHIFYGNIYVFFISHKGVCL